MIFITHAVLKSTGTFGEFKKYKIVQYQFRPKKLTKKKFDKFYFENVAITIHKGCIDCAYSTQFFVNLLVFIVRTILFWL